MAAPAAVLYVNYTFRDAKGNTARMTVLLGGASTAANQTVSATLRGHLAAASNAAVANSTFRSGRDITLGASGEYDTVEDKAVLTFADPQGYFHRFSLPAPKSAVFAADQETVLQTQTDIAAVIADFTTSAYGRSTDTVPLVYVGGTRTRRRQQRRFNIITRNPALTGPGE